MSRLIKVSCGNQVLFIDDAAKSTPAERCLVIMADKLTQPTLDKKVDKFFKKFAIPASVAIGVLNVPLYAFAASEGSLSEKVRPLISLIQELALPVGITVASWGLFEIIIGNLHRGKEKLKYSILGFIGIILIPEVFYILKDTLGM